jgi:hypothetical protein
LPRGEVVVKDADPGAGQDSLQLAGGAADRDTALPTVPELLIVRECGRVQQILDITDEPVRGQLRRTLGQPMSLQILLSGIEA